MNIEIFKTVATELNIPVEVVKEAYQSYWQFIRTTIQELPLKTIETEDEFKELKTNFNVPSLGKFTCTYNRFKGIKKKLEYIQKNNGT